MGALCGHKSKPAARGSSLSDGASPVSACRARHQPGVPDFTRTKVAGGRSPIKSVVRRPVAVSSSLWSRNFFIVGLAPVADEWGTQAALTREMNKSRVEAFSDGVFAFAITLLVVTIAQPENYRQLAHDLARRWPSLAAYIVSFAVIGIMWLNHHSVFGHFSRMDRGLVYLNLLLLMTVAFLPFPTGVLGQALARGQGETTAAVVYGVTMSANAYAWTALWLYASHRRRLLRSSFPESERRVSTLLFTLGSVIYTAAVGVAFLSAYAFLALQAVLAVYYAFDPLSRRAGLAPVAGGDEPGGEGSGAENTTPVASVDEGAGTGGAGRAADGRTGQQPALRRQPDQT